MAEPEPTEELPPIGGDPHNAVQMRSNCKTKFPPSFPLLQFEGRCELRTVRTLKGPCGLGSQTT